MDEVKKCYVYSEEKNHSLRNDTRTRTAPSKVFFPRDVVAVTLYYINPNSIYLFLIELYLLKIVLKTKLLMLKNNVVQTNSRVVTIRINTYFTITLNSSQ